MTGWHAGCYNGFFFSPQHFGVCVPGGCGSAQGVPPLLWAGAVGTLKPEPAQPLSST